MMNENFGIAKRENNPLRDYLIINKFQSKHFPSDPRKTALFCAEMGEEMRRICPSGKCAAIVFAETAIGIGALAANCLGERCFLISTTREELPDGFRFSTFSEEHSHAPLHKICRRADVDLNEIRHIFIIDDELTTGNTMKALTQLITKKVKVPITAHAFAVNNLCVETLGQIGVEVYAKYFYDELPQLDFPSGFSVDEPKITKKPDFDLDLNALYDIRLGVNCKKYFHECESLCGAVFEKLKDSLSGVSCIEVIGTEELCLPPIVFGEMLAEKGFEVRVHGVTRSPVMPSAAEDYPIKTRSVLKSLYEGERTVFLYNKVKCDISVIFTDAEPIDQNSLFELCGACGGDHVAVVRWRGRSMRTSFKAEDCKLLLKDITGKISPLSAEERQKRLHDGTHYCELLPEEYAPSTEYIRLYESGLKTWGRQTAFAVRAVSEQILKRKGKEVALVSLARAGTPIGVLIKRYLKRFHGISAAHYSVSIIRGRGIDKAALKYILARHGADNLQFVDGWTGKGAIARQLAEALKDYPAIDAAPAVLADPAAVCEICGTREDVFIPCSCLNGIVSGLFSRTVLRKDLIKCGDFHGAVYFEELSVFDRTYEFIETICRELEQLPAYFSSENPPPNGAGLCETRRIAERFGVEDINLVKPSIGEATRVLLRRTPEAILLRDVNDPFTAHLAELAKEKNVPIMEFPLECYRAAGIIKN